MKTYKKFVNSRNILFTVAQCMDCKAKFDIRNSNFKASVHKNGGYRCMDCSTIVLGISATLLQEESGRLIIKKDLI